jgi:hypothetical protein
MGKETSSANTKWGGGPMGKGDLEYPKKFHAHVFGVTICHKEWPPRPLVCHPSGRI